MLSVKDLQDFCRTCLVKLEKTNNEDDNKAIQTKMHPELEHIMEICLSKIIVGGDSLCSYAPFLCRSCYEKWSDFLKLYQLAIKTDKIIRKVLEKEAVNILIKPDKCINEHFIHTESLNDVSEVEKYETNSPFYTNSYLNNTFIDIKYKSIPIDAAKSTQFKSQDDLVSSFSDKSNDFDFLSEISKNQKKVNNKNRQKNKNSRKAKCTLKKIYKTRNSLLKIAENQKISSIVHDNVAVVDQNETKKTRYQCEQCNKYFWEKNKYDGHMKQVHEGIRRPYKCLLCDKAYNLYKTLLQHKRECHSDKSQEIFKCEKCDKIFKTAVILKQHLTNKHSEQKESMRSICDQCGFIAAHQYSLSRHIINKHTETDQIKCDQCPKVFKTQYSLKYHVIGNHNPSNQKPFKCSECQMGFSRKTLLNQHKRTHLKYTERIKCDFEGCEVRFVKHGDKTHHMRLVHLKVKQHICDFCGEAFGAMQTLRHHRFIHTGEKPYNCNICGQGFRQRTAMKTHRKTHFGKEAENQDLINNLPEINLSLVNSLGT